MGRTNAGAHPPTPVKLRTTGFGSISQHHSFTQEACFETTLLLIYKSETLANADLSSLRVAHPLYDHLYVMYRRLSTHNFSSLHTPNTNWMEQTHIPLTKKMHFLSCLLHYDMRVADVMQYAGHNYTGAYRDIPNRIETIKHLVDPDLLQHYIRVMTIGAPAQFNNSTTRENTLLHWRMGNHPSIIQKHDQVIKTMNKEDRNNYVIPLPAWVARFCPHIFFTPQHILAKPGKSDRQIFDAS
jgi:hypothetical protein